MKEHLERDESVTARFGNAPARFRATGGRSSALHCSTRISRSLLRVRVLAHRNHAGCLVDTRQHDACFAALVLGPSCRSRERLPRRWPSSCCRKVYQSKFNRKILACQNNLRMLVWLPLVTAIKTVGIIPLLSRAIASLRPACGAPMLESQNLLSKPGREAVCPSSPLADDPKFHEPTLEEVQAMSAAQLAQMLPRLSSYGFTLGYRDNGQGPYKVQKNQHREHFAVASDAPWP